ncbi:hypothetical protein [Myxococcus fulvus]|uniref:hypothetical protein n=1 Tax=Myxococcus fulvus TaxID=33 RepID=UPI0020BFFE71|nr:hypothetical protein [Myxococcus fulvus]MCK8503298.1 hypothetical protein [Myxococcus fulvus]
MRFVPGRKARGLLTAVVCAGLFAGCADGGAVSPRGDAASSSQALTTLPPRVGLTLQAIRDAGSNLPYCDLYKDYLTPHVLQAYYSDQGFDGCVVAWIGDTGETLEVNTNYAEDIYRVYVKRSGPVLNNTVYRKLGDGVGPVDLRLGGPPGSAVNTFTLALDERGFPTVAWLKKASPHFSNVELRAARWDGQAWHPLGGVLNVNDAPDSVASQPVLSWDELERPVLRWVETTGASTVNVTRTWNGSSWE